MTAETELVDDENAVALRRITVGALATNCWAVHAVGDRTALLVDPGDEAPRILAAVADLEITAVVLTHTHFDHVLAVPEIVDALGVPVRAHPADSGVWPRELAHLDQHGHFDAGTATADLLAADPAALRPSVGQRTWNGQFDAVSHRQRLPVGRLVVTLLHTPGHTPGGLTLDLPGHLLTGDTLFPGGPGLTGWPLSDFPTIMTSVRGLLAAPPGTAIHPGHGDDTTVRAERPHIESWQRRGW